MELKLTYTADSVELRKDDRCPRPATTADLVPGQGTSAPRAACVPTSSPEHVNATVIEPTEHHGIPAAPYRRSRAPPVVDADGFTLVRSSKFDMARGLFRHQDTPAPRDIACDVEYPWGIISGGDVRKIKKWAQKRLSGNAMMHEGPGYITYGSYGPDGHES